jgi:capsular exopolysaccharide synthesis family protein
MSEKLPTPVDPGTPPAREDSGLPSFDTPFSLRDLDDDGEGFLRRLLPALKRYWWILGLGGVIGGAAAFMVFKGVPLEYLAEGSIWITTEDRQADLSGPITQGGLLEPGSWVELLTSYEVLDPVVREERLYLEYGSEDSLAFRDFALDSLFSPGDYDLQIGMNGRDFTLLTADGRVLEEGELGGRVGSGAGFLWSPPVGAFPPGEVVAFSVVTPRDAARTLAARVRQGSRLDGQGNFLRLQLEGRDPARIARVLNAVMDRHVAVAADLKRAKMDELTVILQEQLETVESNLRQAEQDLESYQVRTITLPSEETSPIVPGLEQTTGTVFSEFFGLRLAQDELQRYRQRLSDALDQARTSGVQVEIFEMIPPVQTSTPLMGALRQLNDDRAELFVLRERYTDEYGPVAELIRRVRTLEETTIPRLGATLLAELTAREGDMAELIGSRASELSQIPPRAIEEARRERQYQITNDLYVELRRRYSAADLAAASSIPDVRILDWAIVPQVPSADRRIQWAAVALLIPLGIGFLLVMLLDRLDTKLRDPAQIGGQLGLDWLATIPRYRRGSAGRDNSEEIREAFRDLRMKIDYAFGAVRPLLLSITSPAEGEGKTFVAANLSNAFADLGRKTILIDGDTRRGDLHHILDRDRKPGLTDFLMNGKSHQIVQNTENPKLHFIGFGSRTTSSPELLTSSQMQSLLAGLKRRYEVIILDSPPMSAGSDAYVLGAHAGSVLTVLRSGTTNKGLAAAQMESFLRLPVRLLGAVLNDFTPQLGQGYYRYYSHYLPGYEASEEVEAKSEVTKG